MMSFFTCANLNMTPSSKNACNKNVLPATKLPFKTDVELMMQFSTPVNRWHLMHIFPWGISSIDNKYVRRKYIVNFYLYLLMQTQLIVLCIYKQLFLWTVVSIVMCIFICECCVKSLCLYLQNNTKKHFY